MNAQTDVSSNFFHRTLLATAIADQALDVSIGSSGGTFLSAPRRTGKSTFIRQDLIPELKKRNVDVIYVDLWIDKTVNPAIHIANALRVALGREEGLIEKFAKKASVLSKVNVGAFGSGLTFDLSHFNMPKDATLSDAIKALSQAKKKKIVLVIDEAQHALTTSEGMNALFSLKAARDSLNTDAEMYGMQLVATGSNRDKLASLVNGREQAFYGADMIAFPPLGKDYVEWAIDRSKVTIDLPIAFTVFQSLGSRPEPFTKSLKQCVIEIASGSQKIPSDLLADLAYKGYDEARNDFLNTVDNLPPLQSALLKEFALATKPGSGRKIGVFTASMQVNLKDRLLREVGENNGIQVDSSAIQNALDSLREEQFLWKSQRAAYFIEDEQFIDWLCEDESQSSTEQTVIERPRN